MQTYRVQIETKPTFFHPMLKKNSLIELSPKSTLQFIKAFSPATLAIELVEHTKLGGLSSISPATKQNIRYLLLMQISNVGHYCTSC